MKNGTYVFDLWAVHRIGSFGSLFFPKGYYVYVESALLGFRGRLGKYPFLEHLKALLLEETPKGVPSFFLPIGLLRDYISNHAGGKSTPDKPRLP